MCARLANMFDSSNKNTMPRYHIRRSFNVAHAYQQWGAVTINTTASTRLDQALAVPGTPQTFPPGLLGDAGVAEGAFLNRLLQKRFSAAATSNDSRQFRRGEIQIPVRIQAAIVRNRLPSPTTTVWNGHVCNYQSGVNYAEMGGKLSPGMLAHTSPSTSMPPQAYPYDLMAGDHHYKRALTPAKPFSSTGGRQGAHSARQAEDSVRRAGLTGHPHPSFGGQVAAISS